MSLGSNYCGNCSNCLNTFETIDITELANDLIGCILTSGMRFGVNVILDTLRGSKNEKVLRFGLDSNRYYATHAQDTIVFLRQVLGSSRSDGLSGRYRRSVSYCKSERKGTVFLCRVRGIPPRTHDEGSKEDYADTCKSRAASRHGQIRQKAFFPAHRQRYPSRRCAGCVPKSHGHSIFRPILSFPTSHWNPCVSFCLRLKMKCSLSMASAS